MSSENENEINGADGSTMFADANGKEWSLALNVLNVQRVKDLTGEDILAIEEMGQIAAKIFTDDVFVCKVAASICKPAYEAAGETDEQFAAVISNGDTIERMAVALANAIVFFTSSPRRASIAAIMSKGKNAIAAAGKLAERKLNDGTFEAMITKRLAKADKTLSSLAQE